MYSTAKWIIVIDTSFNCSEVMFWCHYKCAQMAAVNSNKREDLLPNTISKFLHACFDCQFFLWRKLFHFRCIKRSVSLYFKCPLFPWYFAGWKITTCVYILVKALYWLAERIQFGCNGNRKIAQIYAAVWQRA